MKITYKEAVKLLLDMEDEDEYRDYSQETENDGLIGGEVGKDSIKESLLEYKDRLEITDKKYHNLYDILCLGITFIADYGDDRHPRIFIPVDKEKLTLWLNQKKK